MANKEEHGRYGDLLDRYAEGEKADYKTEEQRREETRNRYGDMLDHAEPYPIYDRLIEGEDMFRLLRQERQEEQEKAKIRWQERLERDKREEQEHIARNEAIVASYLEKQEAERRAAKLSMEKEQQKAEQRESVINSIRRMTEIGSDMAKEIEDTRAMLERDAQDRKAHEEKMKWYESQKQIGR